MLILPMNVVDDKWLKLDETSPSFSSNMNISPASRFRRAVGTLDDDSDEDPGIDLSKMENKRKVLAG